MNEIVYSFGYLALNSTSQSTKNPLFQIFSLQHNFVKLRLILSPFPGGLLCQTLGAAICMVPVSVDEPVLISIKEEVTDCGPPFGLPSVGTSRDQSALHDCDERILRSGKSTAEPVRVSRMR